LAEAGWLYVDGQFIIPGEYEWQKKVNGNNIKKKMAQLH
jgi:hypothetical protein